MGAIAVSKSEDLRTVAEQQEGIIAGPKSVVAMPESQTFQAESFSHIEYKPQIRYEGLNADSVLTQLLTNQDSTIGRMLGVTERLAGGIFEKATDIVKSVFVQSNSSTESMLKSYGRAVTPGQAESKPVGPQFKTSTIFLVLGIGLGFIYILRR